MKIQIHIQTRGKQEIKRPTPPTHPHNQNHLQKAQHKTTHIIITKSQSHTTIEIQIKKQIHIQENKKQKAQHPPT